MARSEAQKAADKRYAKKINGKYKPFIVNLMPEELESINAVIAASGMKKAEFLRWAVKKLQDGKHMFYPAIFHKNEQGYWVEFPDLPGCNTQGKTIEEACKMAKEALALYLDGAPDIEPSLVDNISVSGSDSVMLIEPDND
mgnify:CR=1 FL=1